MNQGHRKLYIKRVGIKKITMEKEYEILLKNATLSQLCTVSLQHRLPCEWGVVVVNGGVKFFYDGGGDFIDGPYSLNLTCGQDTYFRNNDTSKCVKQVQIFITVVFPGQPGQPFGQAQVCPAGQCILQGGFVLRPKATISKTSLKDKTPFHIEVVSIQ